MVSHAPIAKNAVGLLALSVVCLAIPCAASAKIHAAAKPAPLTKRERAEHAVDRLTFGPRPGDVKRVEKMGVERWIDEQLHPEKMDDASLGVRLDSLPAMRLSTEELIRSYPPPPVIRQVDAGRVAMPSDPVERVIYANALANYRERKEAKADQAQAGQTDASGAKVTPQIPEVVDSNFNRTMLNRTMNVATLLRTPADARWTAVLAMQPGTVRPLVQGMTAAERQQLIAGMTPEQKEVLLALVEPNRVVTEELQQEKLLRAVYSERQLEEVMTQFWSNHFNIYLRKNGEMPWYLAGYERDVIRPHAMSRFEDLLVAVAHSPAMLVYLDNQQSIGPHSVAAIRAAGNAGQKKSAPGLNENYARELMELHTLGVNGGYTQQDVVEVAKVLTGWGTETKQQGYGFEFNERRHEPGDKVVLGHRIQENGEAEGMEVLHLLAMSPATARFLSTNLATEFVSDTPPKSLVDRMTKTYLKTHGDIRQVLSTMFHSPEFWSRDAYRAKLKTPLEFVVSSLRATDADVENASAVAALLDRLGMPLYGVQQPNGYSLKADPWLGAEALLARMNFALALTANRLPGVSVAATQSTESAEQSEMQLEETLLNGRVAAHTHEVVLQEMESAQATPVAAAVFAKGQPGRRSDLFAPAAQRVAPISQSALAAALLLGSPDFQRR
jgi:uncharacterized protein (DUF1800 family)